MSGVAIIGALLLADEPLRAFFAAFDPALDPAGQIKAARLPDSVALPAILVRSLSEIEWQPLVRGSTVPTVERVSVTMRAGSYEDLVGARRLVLAACAGRTGVIANFQSVAVLPWGAGPEVIGPADSFERNQDFRVSFDAPA